ncbi:hypothetical protein AB0873_12385 [Micromonospora sp. NPDC047707]|uniref:hypothetical protein n=1 Tax=Micromonospora sp. NPDC047707 TaxID=3154498 RepID=UPI003455A6E0
MWIEVDQNAMRDRTILTNTVSLIICGLVAGILTDPDWPLYGVLVGGDQVVEHSMSTGHPLDSAAPWPGWSGLLEARAAHPAVAPCHHRM